MRRILARSSRRGILINSARLSELSSARGGLSHQLRHDPAEPPVGDDRRRRRRHGPSVVHHRFFEHRIPLDGGCHGELVVVVDIITLIVIDLER